MGRENGRSTRTQEAEIHRPGRNCTANGWKTWCFPVEIGCRGFPGNALWRAFKMLGIVGKERRFTIEEAGRKAGNGVPMDMVREERPYLGEGSM